MRVLQLAPWVTFGGADRGTIDWLRTLAGRGVEAYLLTTQESDNALFAEAEGWAKEAWCLPELMPGPRMPAFIEDFVASRDIDVVQVMNSKLGFDLLPGLRARFPHLRTVAQLHAEEEGRAGYPAYVATRFDDVVDAYSLVSQGLAERMGEYGVDAAKAHVIYLGVDAGVFDPDRVPPALAPASSGLQVLFPHRLVDQKDPMLMVEVAAALRDRGSAAVIHVVGDGGFGPALEQAIEEAGLTRHVMLHGSRRDMPGWYAGTDVALLTSRYEGVPLVAYEAMAMGRPVVAGDVGAVGELIDETTGFVVEPRDSVEGYVAALLTLEADPGLRHRLGQEGRRRVMSRFTVEGMGQAHEQLYARLVVAGRSTPGEPAGDGGSTRAGGRWSVLWWGEDEGPLADPGFLGKAAEVARHSPEPVFVGLSAGDGHSWRPADPVPGAPMLGALVQSGLLPRLAGQRPRLWRSFPVGAGGGTPGVPRHVVGRRSLLRGRRLPSAPTRGFVCDGPNLDQAPAWTPPETAQLWFVPHDDDVRLHVGDRPPDAGPDATLLGRVFTRPFWRTLPVVSDGRGLHIGEAGDAVGHVLSAGLPGMVELHVVLEAALAELGIHAPDPPLLQGQGGPAWIDLPELPPDRIWPDE